MCLNFLVNFFIFPTGKDCWKSKKAEKKVGDLFCSQAFAGHKSTSADWVLSITSLSGALNGTTRVFLDGIWLVQNFDKNSPDLPFINYHRTKNSTFIWGGRKNNTTQYK